MSEFMKKVYEYARNRLHKHVELIAKNFGTLLTVIVLAIFGLLIAMSGGATPDVGGAVGVMLGALSYFLVTLIRATFGKPTNGEEPSE